MKNKSIFFLIFIALISCHQGEKNKLIENSFADIKNDTQKSGINISNDTSQNSLSNLSDTLVLNLKIDSINDHLTVPINITAGKVLNASLSAADSNANIRINQVELPDSTFDGPFGKEIHYKMTTPGNYKIIIAENMMAADQWRGDFILRIWVR